MSTVADAAKRDRPDWHGRRRGRRLTSHRQDLLAGLLPRLRISLSPGGEEIDPAGLFPHRPQAIWIEIGFGSGEHLAEQARRHPEIGFIGCEVFVNGVASLLGRVERLGLSNVRIFDDDARLLLALLPAASVDRAFLLFPDPWPKARHAKRRFVGPATLAILERLLADKAHFWVATDDPGYARWTLQQIVGRTELIWRARRPRDWRDPPDGWVETRYQRKAAIAGRATIFLCFERQPRDRVREKPCG